jgi:hypothetical protein
MQFSTKGFFFFSNRNMNKAESTVGSFETGSLCGRSCWVDGQRVIATVGREIRKELDV